MKNKMFLSTIWFFTFFMVEDIWTSSITMNHETGVLKFDSGSELQLKPMKVDKQYQPVSVEDPQSYYYQNLFKQLFSPNQQRLISQEEKDKIFDFFIKHIEGPELKPGWDVRPKDGSRKWEDYKGKTASDNEFESFNGVHQAEINLIKNNSQSVVWNPSVIAENPRLYDIVQDVINNVDRNVEKQLQKLSHDNKCAITRLDSVIKDVLKNSLNDNSDVAQMVIQHTKFDSIPSNMRAALKDIVSQVLNVANNDMDFSDYIFNNQLSDTNITIDSGFTTPILFAQPELPVISKEHSIHQKELISNVGISSTSNDSQWWSKSLIDKLQAQKNEISKQRSESQLFAAIMYDWMKRDHIGIGNAFAKAAFYQSSGSITK